MLKYIIRKFLPFGLARTISLAGIPVLQFIILNYCSKVESGRFYLLTAVAFIVSQIADMGLSRAAPVLFGDSEETAHKLLPEIIQLRWFLGILLGSFFVVFNRFGSVEWLRESTGLLIQLFCIGRVILLGNQGYRHSKQEFTKLFWGSIINLLAMCIYYLLIVKYSIFNTSTALAGLTIGIWSELVFLDSPLAHPFNKSSGEWGKAFKFIFPFASVGITTAFYNRIEALVAGYYLSPEFLGIFGALDQSFKLAIWPSYLSAQAIFPEVNSAIENKKQSQLKRTFKRHILTSASICIVVMTGVTFILFSPAIKTDGIRLSAVLLLAAVWMAIPASLIDTLFFSMRMQKKYALIKLMLTISRLAFSIFLVLKFSFVGLCATHAIMTTIALIVSIYYLGISRKNASKEAH